MPKKKIDPPLSPIADINVGLLQKAGAANPSAKWCSPGESSKKLQRKLFGSGSPQIINEKNMICEEVLLDGEDLYVDGVPDGLEDRYYRYRVDSFEEGKKGNPGTFYLTYLEQCIKHDGKEWISLPDDSEDGSGKFLKNFPKSLVLDGHARMTDKLAIIREYHVQENNVLKASLESSKTEPSRAEDVDVLDLVEAANADRGKGWSSYRVIEVSCV